MNTYGIHTFEIMIPHMSKQDYRLLKDKLKPISEYVKDGKYYLVHTQRDSGVRIRLYTNPNFPPYLTVIVNPWKLLNKVRTPMDHAMILLPGFDKKALRDRLCKQLHIYIGDEFETERFMLTRIDCTTDISFDNSHCCGVYINQVRNSIGWAVEKEEKKYDDPETYRYYFRLSQPGSYSFTVYDKIYDLMRMGKLADKPYNHGLLRFELSFEHRKINDVKKKLGTDDIIDLAEYYTDHSEEFIKKFLQQRFAPGDFYSFSAVQKYLENNCRRKMRCKLITLLNGSEDMNRRELENKMYRIFESESKIRTVKNAMKEFELAPILIPCRYDIEYLPGLNKLFDISDRQRSDK